MMWWKKKKDHSDELKEIHCEIEFNPIKDEDEAIALLNHMNNPEKYPDPSQEKGKKNGVACTNIHCSSCDNGYYVRRTGQYGDFFGCSKFPKCKNTKSISDITYSLLKENGINIYEVEKPCWKCKKHIKIRSYFPQIDLMMVEPSLAGIGNLYAVKLSVIPTLDEILSQKYNTIRVKESKKAGFSYMANICPHCDALQGSQMTLCDVYDFLEERLRNQEISPYLIDKIVVDSKIIPKEIWDEIIKQVLKQ